MGTGKRLKQYLISNHISQVAISELLNVTPQNISSILKEKSNLTLVLLEKLTNKYWDLDMRWLITGKGKMLADGQTNLPGAVKVPKDYSNHCIVRTVDEINAPFGDQYVCNNPKCIAEKNKQNDKIQDIQEKYIEVLEELAGKKENTSAGSA